MNPINPPTLSNPLTAACVVTFLTCKEPITETVRAPTLSPVKEQEESMVRFSTVASFIAQNSPEWG